MARSRAPWANMEGQSERPATRSMLLYPLRASRWPVPAEEQSAGPPPAVDPQHRMTLHSNEGAAILVA